MRLILAAAAFAVVAVGSAEIANASTAGALASAHIGRNTLIQQTRLHKHCVWRHHHRHCWWH